MEIFLAKNEIRMASEYLNFAKKNGGGKALFAPRATSIDNCLRRVRGKFALERLKMKPSSLVETLLLLLSASCIFESLAALNVEAIFSAELAPGEQQPRLKLKQHWQDFIYPEQQQQQEQQQKQQQSFELSKRILSSRGEEKVSGVCILAPTSWPPTNSFVQFSSASLSSVQFKSGLKDINHFIWL